MYLADKYKVDETFYPTEAQQRAIINHRLSFYLSTFYKAISEYVVSLISYTSKHCVVVACRVD